jgi:hypothetical protein
LPIANVADAGDIVRYRMTPSVAAAVLDSLAVANPNAKG